jgi:hypothetical protein
MPYRRAKHLHSERSESLSRDFISQWLTEEEATHQIADMGVLADGGRRSATEIQWEEEFSAEELESFELRAKKVLEEPLTSGVFSDDDLDMSLVYRDTSAIKFHGLTKTVQERIDGLKYRGLSRDQLIQSLDQFPLASNLLDLMDHGQRAFMKPEFLPNGESLF